MVSMAKQSSEVWTYLKEINVDCWLKNIVTTWKSFFFFLWECLVGMCSSEKTALRRKEGKSGYIQVSNKGNRQSEHQRSGVQLRNLTFFVWEDASLWAPWIQSFHVNLSCLGPILFPCSCCFLNSPAPQQLLWGWQHLLDHSLGSPHSLLEARNCWWLWHFLFVDMAGNIFISHDPTWGMCTCAWSSVMSDSAIPWTEAHRAPLSMGFSRQVHWNGLPFPSQDLPDPGIELVSLMSLALADRFFTTEPPGKPT